MGDTADNLREQREADLQLWRGNGVNVTELATFSLDALAGQVVLMYGSLDVLPRLAELEAVGADGKPRAVVWVSASFQLTEAEITAHRAGHITHWAFRALDRYGLKNPWEQRESLGRTLAQLAPVREVETFTTHHLFSLKTRCPDDYFGVPGNVGRGHTWNRFLKWV